MAEREETDVLVIGTGAAGLTAAIAAHEFGASVRLVEKSDKIGGTSAISGGIIWAPDNPKMRADGEEDSPNAAAEYILSLAGTSGRPEMVEAFTTTVSEAIDFLEAQGATELATLPEYPDYYLTAPGAKHRGGRVLDSGLFAYADLGDWSDKLANNGLNVPMTLAELPLGGGDGKVDPAIIGERVKTDQRGMGQALVGRLLKACLDRNIEPLLNARVTRLTKQGNRVTGAIVETGDGDLEITTNHAVIIATGGFEWNKDMVDAFLSGPMTAPASRPTSTGDGQILAMEAGGMLANMQHSWWVPTVVTQGVTWEDGSQRSAPILFERTFPHTIMVNKKGQRFCNEAANYPALSGPFHAFDENSYSYKNLPAYLIFDDQCREKYMMLSMMLPEEVPDWVARGDTLHELAAKVGINGDGLAKAVAHFNADAAAGRDDLFNRGKSEYDHFHGDKTREGALSTLGELTKAPFYAVEVNQGTLGTNGGAKTDAKGRVVDARGKVIEGLFAAGNAMACPTGRVYAGAGGTLGPAITYGYITGREAARPGNQ